MIGCAIKKTFSDIFVIVFLNIFDSWTTKYITNCLMNSVLFLLKGMSKKKNRTDSDNLLRQVVINKLYSRFYI